MFPFQRREGSSEDEQVARNARKFLKGDAASSRMYVRPAPFGATPRSAGPAHARTHAEPRPHVNPLTWRRTLVEVVKTSHVMQWCLFGNGMF